MRTLMEFMQWGTILVLESIKMDMLSRNTIRAGLDILMNDLLWIIMR